MSCPDCAADSDGLCGFHAGVKAEKMVLMNSPIDTITRMVMEETHCHDYYSCDDVAEKVRRRIEGDDY